MKHLVIPDCQVKAGVLLEHLEWAGRYICEKRPDVVVMIGDFADMPSLSSFDKGKKSFEGRRYKTDITAARKGMETLLTPLAKEKGYKPRLVLTMGNHEERINWAVDSDPKLDGTISQDDLGYAADGWEVVPFLKPICIDGIMYAHYFTSGPMGRPVASAAALLTKKHQSCVMGHVQQRQIAYATKANGKQITGLFAGAFYQHSESYLGPQGNQHWRGLWVLHEVHDGSFDEMPVSIEYLKRKFAPKGRRK